MTPERTGQVTTFYSFKGGVGRTFLLANVAWLLARWGRRVLCLDWDLEAPGLHHYLAPLAPPRPGVLDLIQALGKKKIPDWRAWIDPVTGPWTGEGRLDLLRAGREDAAYLKGVQSLDWRKLAKAGFAGRLEEVRAAWVADYDHVIVDSRTGITDVGGICAAQLPDVLVLAFTATLQSLHGADRVAKLATETRAGLPLDRGRFRVLPVPSRVHTGEETALEAEWSQRFIEVMGPWIRPWLHVDLEPAEPLAHLRIREQARWSFGEQMPVTQEGVTDPHRISWAFANVAALVDRGLRGAHDVLRTRQDTLAALAGAAGLDAPHRTGKGPVFISYPRTAVTTARSVASSLRRLGVPTESDADLIVGDRWDEALYRTREQAGLFVVIIPDHPLGHGQTDELAHIQRLYAGDAVVIPVFLGPRAMSFAPPWLAKIFGLVHGQDGVDDMVVAQAVARMYRRESPVNP
jgi:MinD-like ATPase involved in chromosome partitioning or flagellar assembly